MIPKNNARNAPSKAGCFGQSRPWSFSCSVLPYFHSSSATNAPERAAMRSDNRNFALRVFAERVSTEERQGYMTEKVALMECASRNCGGPSGMMEASDKFRSSRTAKTSDAVARVLDTSHFRRRGRGFPARCCFWGLSTALTGAM